MVIYWVPGKPVKRDESIQLPEHVIDSVSAENITSLYTIGESKI